MAWHPISQTITSVGFQTGGLSLKQPTRSSALAKLIGLPVKYFKIWLFAEGWADSLVTGVEVSGRHPFSWTPVGRELLEREMTVLWACHESLMMFWWLLRVATWEPPVRKGCVRTPTWSAKAVAPFIKTALMIPTWTGWGAYYIFFLRLPAVFISAFIQTLGHFKLLQNAWAGFWLTAFDYIFFQYRDKMNIDFSPRHFKFRVRIKLMME